MINDRFGPRVGTIVGGLTHRNYREEIAAMGIAHDDPQYQPMRNAFYASDIEAEIIDPEVALIKYCDITANTAHIDRIPDAAEQAKRLLKYISVLTLFVERFSQSPHPALNISEETTAHILQDLAEKEARLLDDLLRVQSLSPIPSIPTQDPSLKE
ncbi:MAG: hypothetical protein ACREGI_01370 [Candidatus Levyibacteriota bacterium]